MRFHFSGKYRHFFLMYQQTRVMKRGAFNNGRKYKRLMSVSGMPRCVDIMGSARVIAIYFTKRKLPRARRIAPFPRDKRAARWLKYFKENRSSRLSISFEESCKSILTAGRASYEERRTVIRVFRGRGGGGGRENTGTQRATVFAYIVHSRSC